MNVKREPKRQKCKLYHLSRWSFLLPWPYCALPSQNPAPGSNHSSGILKIIYRQSFYLSKPVRGEHKMTNRKWGQRSVKFSKMFSFSSLKSVEGTLGLGSQMCFPDHHLLLTEGHSPSTHMNCVQPAVSQLNIASGSQSYLPQSEVKGQVKQSRRFLVRDPFLSCLVPQGWQTMQQLGGLSQASASPWRTSGRFILMQEK